MKKSNTFQMKIAGISILFFLIFISNHLYAHDGSGHDHIHHINSNYQLYQICKNDIEGFAEKINGRDYHYPSIRQDVSNSLISRASDGKMPFEFLTGIVPSGYNKPNVSFFFISDIDLNHRQHFDVFVNGRFLLTFKANEKGSLDIIQNSGNGNAEYFLIERDQNGDGIGTFRLTVPSNLIEKNERTRIKIQGQKNESTSWFMIFKTSDVIERLKVSAQKEASFSIKQYNELLLVDAPAHFAGKTIYIRSDSKKSKKVILKLQGEIAKASLKINPPKNSFTLFYDDEFIEIKFPNNDGVLTKTDIYGVYLYYHKTYYKDGWRAGINKLHRPNHYTAYQNFFDEKYKNGKVAIMNSSHQDIAWVDRPEVCIILRDTLLLSPILKDAFSREDYGFDIEDGLMLREYLGRHPDAREKISTLLNKKLISVGASYNCPYEDMYDAEDQVRQLYLGKKWVKKMFNGYDSKVYWNVDVPGKTLQFPQILKKAGVDYMVISRHARGFFNWASPDGSSVFTYSPGHYGTDLINLSRELANKISYGAEQVVEWDKFYENSRNHTPLLSSQDMLPAIDYSDFITSWNNTKSVKNEAGEKIAVHFPEMELMTMDEFLPLAEKNVNKVTTIQGERPNVWLYIHGPAHHKALTASREASKLLPAAEKFLSISNILDPIKMPYPYKKFDLAWQSKIYPDHGWGGHDGDITDNLFKEHLVKSKEIGNDLLNKGINFIAGRIKTNEKYGIPVVLFNSLSWERTDPVKITINLPKGKAKSLSVFSGNKKKITSQLTNTELYEDGSVKKADIVFIAHEIPSVGYKTYYIKYSLQAQQKTKRTVSDTQYENNNYLISFDKGGISQIYDKDLKRNLFRKNGFKVGEVFTMQSVGNGAGEFGDVQQPTMKDFDKVSTHHPGWKVLENGDVYTTYRTKQAILHTIVEQDVTIYHELKRVLFETKLLNWSGELYREFRTAFPVDIENAKITHEVPFGTVKVGQDEINTAGERYTPLCKDVHPRAIIDWISASDNKMAVTLSSSVAAADWIDPTNENNKALLQHLLLASRTSCHWEGNEYSQGGSHYFHNILTSNSAGEITGTRMAKQHNEPVKIVLNPEKSVKASLPESLSFFSIDKKNVIITTIKNAEDEEGLIVRLYDAEGKNSTVNLKSFFDIEKMLKTNIIEENPKATKEINIGKFAIETYLLKMK